MIAQGICQQSFEKEMLEKKRVSLHTLGCKLNQAEGDTLLRACQAQGYEVVSFGEPADLVLINTCSVTEQADAKCRAVLGRARRSVSGGAIVVMGCYAQLQPQRLLELRGVTHVVGTKDKAAFFSNLDSSLKGPPLWHAPIQEATQFHAAHTNTYARSRAVLKVQDGCDYGCTFCTIPLARGQSRSATLKDICAQALRLEAEGVKEIVLSGVNLGDIQVQGMASRRGQGLCALLEALSRATNKVYFRLSSVEPNLLSNELVDFVAEHPRWMPHFHLPLQSGSDAVLARMRRRYRAKDYIARLQYIRARMPDACIGADVLVGFPGETTKDFNQTYHLLCNEAVSYLHVFPYAERPSTPALALKDVIAKPTRQARAAQLRQLSYRKYQAFMQAAIGNQAELLLEQKESQGYLLGHTQQYIRAGLVATSKECTLRAGSRHQVCLQAPHTDGNFLKARCLPNCAGCAA